MIQVVPASPGQEPVIANLLELYAHDFSEFHPLELAADGRFGYHDLPLYWSDPDRHAFLVEVNGRLAGLVLLKTGSEVSGDARVWDVREFFIVRGYRRRGIGMKVAHDVWRKFPGQWEVRVMESNRDAFKFWQRAIATFIGGTVQPTSIEKDGERWHVFAFECESTG